MLSCSFALSGYPSSWSFSCWMASCNFIIVLFFALFLGLGTPLLTQDGMKEAGLLVFWVVGWDIPMWTMFSLGLSCSFKMYSLMLTKCPFLKGMSNPPLVLLRVPVDLLDISKTVLLWELSLLVICICMRLSWKSFLPLSINDNSSGLTIFPLYKFWLWSYTLFILWLWVLPKEPSRNWVFERGTLGIDFEVRFPCVLWNLRWAYSLTLCICSFSY